MHTASLSSPIPSGNRANALRTRSVSPRLSTVKESRRLSAASLAGSLRQPPRDRGRGLNIVFWQKAQRFFTGRRAPVRSLSAVSFGVWEGHTWAEVDEMWPEEYQAYQEDRMKVAPPGGESLGDARRRILAALDAIAAGPGETALAVCHSGVIRAVLGWQAGVPFDNKTLYRLNVPNAQWVAVAGDRTGVNR